MVDQQVNSFVQKFRDLWREGHSAHLDIDCHGGEAWLGLRLRLGQQLHRGSDSEHRRGASYSRHMERRAAQRAAEQAANNVVREVPAHAEQAAEVV